MTGPVFCGVRRPLSKWGVVLALTYGVAATIYAFAAMCGSLTSELGTSSPERTKTEARQELCSERARCDRSVASVSDEEGSV